MLALDRQGVGPEEADLQYDWVCSLPDHPKHDASTVDQPRQRQHDYVLDADAAQIFETQVCATWHKYQRQPEVTSDKIMKWKSHDAQCNFNYDPIVNDCLFYGHRREERVHRRRLCRLGPAAVDRRRGMPPPCVLCL